MHATKSNPPPPARVVVDTNVLFGASWGTKKRSIVDAWEDGEVTLCVSDATLAEYRHILKKTPQSRRMLKRVENNLQDLPNTLHVTPLERVKKIRDDPSDNMWLECAIAADARYVLSSDHHVKRANGFRGIAVTSTGKLLRDLPRIREAESERLRKPGLWRRLLDRVLKRFSR